MCRGMVDIHSATAEIRRGKKEEEEEGQKKPQGKYIISASATQGGHNKIIMQKVVLMYAVIVKMGKLVIRGYRKIRSRGYSAQ